MAREASGAWEPLAFPHGRPRRWACRQLADSSAGFLRSQGLSESPWACVEGERGARAARIRARCGQGKGPAGHWQTQVLAPRGCNGGAEHSDCAEEASRAREPRAFVHAAAEATGLPGASADLVAACLVCHELPVAAMRALLAEALRLLRPGGAVCIMVGARLQVQVYVGSIQKANQSGLRRPCARCWPGGAVCVIVSARL